MPTASGWKSVLPPDRFRGSLVSVLHVFLAEKHLFASLPSLQSVSKIKEALVPLFSECQLIANGLGVLGPSEPKIIPVRKSRERCMSYTDGSLCVIGARVNNLGSYYPPASLGIEAELQRYIKLAFYIIDAGQISSLCIPCLVEMYWSRQRIRFVCPLKSWTWPLQGFFFAHLGYLLVRDTITF